MSACKSMEKKQEPAELNPSGSLIIPGQPTSPKPRLGGSQAAPNPKAALKHGADKERVVDPIAQDMGVRVKSASVIESGSGEKTPTCPPGKERGLAQIH